MHSNSKKIRDLASSLKKNPDDSFIKFALALELLKKDDVSKARILFESILKHDPDYVGVYYHLGKLYEKTGRLQEAQQMYLDGIEIAQEQNEIRTEKELKEALESIKIKIENDFTS